LKQFYHNPRVGGSSPSCATIFIYIINNLYFFKKDIEAIFALRTSYTLSIIPESILLEHVDEFSNFQRHELLVWVNNIDPEFRSVFVFGQDMN
jgi:hypothetical protein